MSSTGTLVVKPLTGRFLRDTDTFGKMDPYCIFKVGTQKQRSKTHSRGGKLPKWSDVITFHITGEDKMIIEVYDKDTLTRDDLIGTAEIQLGQFMQEGEKTKKFQINYKSRNAGQIEISIEFQTKESRQKTGYDQKQFKLYPNLQESHVPFYYEYPPSFRIEYPPSSRIDPPPKFPQNSPQQPNIQYPCNLPSNIPPSYFHQPHIQQPDVLQGPTAQHSQYPSYPQQYEQQVYNMETYIGPLMGHPPVNMQYNGYPSSYPHTHTQYQTVQGHYYNYSEYPADYYNSQPGYFSEYQDYSNNNPYYEYTNFEYPPYG